MKETFNLTYLGLFPLGKSPSGKGMGINMDETQNRLEQGRLEQMEDEIQRLLQESKDYYFTEYLQNLMLQLREQKYRADLLKEDLDRSYHLYLQRNPVPSENVPAPGNESPQLRTDSFVHNNQPGILQNHSDMNQEYMSDSYFKETVQNQTVSAANADVAAGCYTEASVVSQPQPYHKAPARNVEFFVGVAVFSVIGVVFILASFVMLGMNFMSGFVRGMSLYAISIILLTVSVLVINRKNAKISMTVTSIGVGGLYLSTMMNYLHLHNFGGQAAVLITTFITVGALVVSRKKESWLLRVIGMAACYLCLFLIRPDIGQGEFLIVVLILFLLNVLCAVLPVRGVQSALGITQMLANTIFSQFLLWRAEWYGVSKSGLAAFVISSVIVLNIIFCLLLRQYKKQQTVSLGYDSTGAVSAFCISATLFVIQLFSVLYDSVGDNLWVKHISMAALLVITLVFFLLERKSEEKWLQYILLNLTSLTVYGLSGNIRESVICILTMLVVSKLLTGVKAVRASEAVITTVACLAALIYRDQPYAAVLAMGVILSVLFIHNWQTYYEILLTGTLALLASVRLPNLIMLPTVAGIFFVAILLFHNIKRYRGNGIRGFNYFALSVQCLAYLALANRIYTRAYVTYLMMLVFGIAMIIITFHERYQMEFRHRHLIMAAFLTYMAFVCRTGIPVLTSILLMVIALISVGYGFGMKEKTVRIYGLALSLFVCAKVTLYDFYGAPILQKMLLFFVVGVIALVISGIYILLEKKGNASQEAVNGGNMK